MDYKKWLSLIGVIIFVYILWHIGWTDLTSSFKKINLFYFLITVLMVVPLLMLYTYKWFVILKLQGFKVPFFRLFLISLIGIYYGSITPSRGGAIIRSVYLKDYCKENLGKCTSSFFLERVFDVLAILGLAFFSIFFVANIVNNFLIYLIIFLICFLIAFWFFYSKKRSIKVCRLFYEMFTPKKYKEKLKEIFDSFYESLPPIRKCYNSFFIVLLYWLGDYIFAYIVALSFGFKISFFAFLSIIPIVTFISMIPITINGLGTRELTMGFLFGKFGVPFSDVVAFSVLSMFLVLIIPSLAGFFISLKWKDFKS